MDVIQQRWNDWVIKFGASHQARMFSPLGLDRVTPLTLVIIMFAAISLISVILLPFVLRVKGPGRKDPLQAAWQKFLKRLKSAGFDALPSNGALELAHAAALSLPSDSPAIHQIADLYNRYRYSLAPPPLEELKSAIADFHPKKTAV